MEILKRTEEYRMETEESAKEFIADLKAKENEQGYEVTSYTITHKVKKDDDFFLTKVIRVYI